MIHTDLLDNDFSALLRTLHNDPDSYQCDQHNVFADSVGRLLLSDCKARSGKHEDARHEVWNPQRILGVWL